MNIFIFGFENKTTLYFVQAIALGQKENIRGLPVVMYLFEKKET
jgi:hypothetical protein